MWTYKWPKNYNNIINEHQFDDINSMTYNYSIKDEIRYTTLNPASIPLE